MCVHRNEEVHLEIRVFLSLSLVLVCMLKKMEKELAIWCEDDRGGGRS